MEIQNRFQWVLLGFGTCSSPSIPNRKDYSKTKLHLLLDPSEKALNYIFTCKTKKKNTVFKSFLLFWNTIWCAESTNKIIHRAHTVFRIIYKGDTLHLTTESHLQPFPKVTS